MAHQLLSASKHKNLQQQPSNNEIKVTRSKNGTNVSQKILTECQVLIAFACYDSPVIMQGRVSMREATLESLMAKYCFGDSVASKDSEILTYVDQFLHGLNKELKELYETEGTIEMDQQDVLTMLPTLHCQIGLNIYICSTKKMMALVTNRKSPYKNGTYPSGMAWDDYAKWCLSAFITWNLGLQRIT